MRRLPTRIIFFTLSRQYLSGVFTGLIFAVYFNRCPPCQETIESHSFGRVPMNNELLDRLRDQEAPYLPPFEDSMKQERILCWILTSPDNQFKAEMLKKTWGRKCDKLLFMSSQNETSLPTIALPIGQESRQQLWKKVKLALRHIYTHHLNDYDWFFKADDDTYTIFENLRQFTSTWNSSLPLFLGRQFYFGENPGQRPIYMSGGAGYLLTREALRRFVEVGLDQDACKIETDYFEDVNVGRCLENTGVTFGDSRDRFGRQRFIPYSVSEFYSGKGENMDFLSKHDTGGLRLGPDCCSNEAVTFHYVSGHDMEVYEYLLYSLKITNVTRLQ